MAHKKQLSTHAESGDCVVFTLAPYLLPKKVTVDKIVCRQERRKAMRLSGNKKVVQAKFVTYLP